LSQATASAERRRWQRLSVPVPMFIRGVDERGKEFLEFSTALNIGAGGALLVSRRFLPSDSKILLEIPPAPYPKEKSKARSIKAKVVHVRNSDRYHLCSLEFSRPLAIN
jgi:c-di-GMP-binding flagellar brake protein YcgR